MFGATMRIAVLLTCGALVLAGCGGSGSGGGSGGAGGGGGGAGGAKKLTPWSMGIIAPHGDAGFLYMAQAKGFAKQLGIDLQIKPFTGGVPLLEALLSGSIDAAEGSPTGILPAASQGAGAKIVAATTVSKPNYAMFATKDIGSFSELKGKTVGVSAPGALPDLITRAMLAAEGVDPHSVTIANVGSDSQRIQALLAGRVQAVPDSVEYEPKVANDKGIHVIGTSSRLIPQYPQYVTMVSAQAIKNKASAIPRFIAAQIRGASYALAHPAQEKALSAKVTGDSPSDPALRVKYEIDKSSHAIRPDGSVPKADLVWLQNLMVRYGFQKKKADINKLVVNSYREKALAILHGKRGG